MNPLEAVALVAVLFLPFHGLVLWQIARLQNSAYLREYGVVVVLESARFGNAGQNLLLGGKHGVIYSTGALTGR